MLTDPEAEEIARARDRGVGGPILMKWVDQLLADRRERVAQLAYLRQRLAQAFRYLDGLIRDDQRPPAVAPPPRPPRSETIPACPRCGSTYIRASGMSPGGTLYIHSGGRECRTRPSR